MEDSVQKSCWGVALKAATILAVAMFTAWLIGVGGDAGTVLAVAK